MLFHGTRQRYNCLVIPQFDSNGALPVGQHACEWDEFVERFEGKADNKRRRRLVLGLAQMCFLLVEAGCQTIWIDGSFVRRERWPKDFDLCYDLSQVNTELLHPLLADLSNGRSQQKRNFGGEALPHDMPFQSNGETVLEAFTRDRNGNSKGLIQLDSLGLEDALKKWITQRISEEKEDG